MIHRPSLISVENRREAVHINGASVDDTPVRKNTWKS
jgi:hypothetical protein